MRKPHDIDAGIDSLLAGYGAYVAQGPETEDRRHRVALVLALYAPEGKAEDWCARHAKRLRLASEALQNWQRLVHGILPLRGQETQA